MDRNFGFRWWVALLLVISTAIYCVQAQPDGKPIPAPGLNKGPAKPAKEVPPGKPNTVFVWPAPNHGHQSLLCLNVIDGNTFEAAYLVPVRIRLTDVDLARLTDKESKEAHRRLDDVINGQLLPAFLMGQDNQGNILADIWIHGQTPEKSKWLSDRLRELKENPPLQRSDTPAKRLP